MRCRGNAAGAWERRYDAQPARQTDGACPALAAAAALSIPATLIVDHAVLANEDVRRERPLTVAPWADPKWGAAGVAATGTF